MHESSFKKRKRVKRFLGSRVAIFALLLIVIFLSRATWNVLQKERETKSTLEDVKSRQEDLSSQEIFLTSEIGRLQTEEGIEEEVRDRYGLAHSDERVIILVDDDEDEASEIVQKGFWSKVKGWFKN